jgi:hypothetical protein
MSHRDAVADGYCVELKGDAARLTDGLLDNLGHFVQMNVAGDYLAETVGDGDKGFVDISVTYTAGVQQGAVWRPLKTFFYCVASHIYIFLSVNCRPTGSGKLHHFNSKAGVNEEK